MNVDKETASQYIHLIQALADGKTIQWRDSSGSWEDTPKISSVWGAECYRIKPEPREIWVNHYDEGLKLDQVCDSRDEADRRAHEGYGLVQKRYREVLE